ncbi:hypothetical protein [Propionivibrio limicola]|uniref:hypothetical protein n=1 Tax=Propionivibrio limicola TaxID=167645 RepID=UPI001291BC12|nr:hypothetical protein [Propionivibrio limicola]
MPTARATIAAEFPSLSAAATAQYNSYAERPTVAMSAAEWQYAAPVSIGAQENSQSPRRDASGSESRFTPADTAQAGALSAMPLALDALPIQHAEKHATAAPAASRSTAAHQDAARDRRASRAAHHQDAARLRQSRSARHQDTLRTSRRALASPYSFGSTAHGGFDSVAGAGADVRSFAQSYEQNAIRPAAGKWVKPTEPETTGYEPTANLLFFRPSDGSAALLFGNDGDALSAAVIVPIRRRYIVINTQSLMRVGDGLTIPASDIKVSIDVDSWAWGWSATVPGAYLYELQAGIGELVELEANVNGHTFRLSVETIQSSRSFGKSTLSVSGRSRAAWLAAPYADIANRANTTQMTAQQLMALALTENGVSLGWDIDWQITDWIVPAGVWSHSGTAIEACMSIAEAVGAYIQSDPNDQVLRVQPRYPAAPWGWDDLTPDIELPEDVCVTEGIEFVDKPAYNTVFVSGQAQGVLGHVTRGGTDGSRAAPMIIDPLVTHADAARQRGTAVLSDTGRQKLISLSLPVLEETGIILPGKLVRYTESGKTHLGLSRSVDVEAKFPKVRQTIMLESHVL